MQQLQNASDPIRCAREVLETLLEVMVRVREKKARRHRGTSLVHMRAMGVLRKRPGATLSMVADQLALTLSATSRLVDCLVEQGLVRRQIPAGNRRTVSLMLSPAGNRALEAIMRETQRDLAGPLAGLSDSQRDALCASMGTLRDVMAADAALDQSGRNHVVKTPAAKSVARKIPPARNI